MVLPSNFTSCVSVNAINDKLSHCNVADAFINEEVSPDFVTLFLVKIQVSDKQ